jgi:hypothetical protein
MVPIQVIPNTTKREAEIVEEEWRVKLEAKMNTRKASRGQITVKEYKKQHYIDNKDIIRSQQTIYRNDNKNKINIKNKIKQTCKCGCLVTSINLARHQTSNKCIKLMESKEN